jgi:N-acetylglucosaminyldiphosphoundecaprenol N-acetyl-beta-D-mannosaminyltransferase
MAISHVRYDDAYDDAATLPDLVDLAKTLPDLEVHLLGRRITCMTVSSIVEAIHTACVEQKKMTVAHCNVHGFNLSMQLPWFYNFLQSSDIVHCDGTGILKAIRFMGTELPIQYRVSYTQLLPELLQHCNQHRFSIFLLGSQREHLQRAMENVWTHYPDISLSGHDGYFNMNDAAENDAIVEQINAVRPNILLVGMGMPRQENWIRQNRHRLSVNAILAGGAAIDRLAGAVSACPAFLSDAGLEWLYRLLHEPKRLATRYLLGNPAFLMQIALAKVQVRPTEVLVIQPQQQLSYMR